MKWIARSAIAVLVLALMAPAVMAQEEHGEFGVFADYTRFHNLNNQNFWGAGAILGFNLGKHVQLEGTMGYDFERNFVTSGSTTLGTASSFQNTKFRILNGYFGPKFQTGVGPFKAFIAIKPGFENFGLTNKGVATGFVNSVSNVPSGDTHFSLYPSGGIEWFFANKFGIRAEIGDTLYWQGKFTDNAGTTFGGGVQHNLTFRFGPQFRW